ncbi:MAG: chemotaxis protein CheX [Bryobacterales bacterium]|nr:chemotaxis protein CheX [Bryobacterales bacterium]
MSQEPVVMLSELEEIVGSVFGTMLGWPTSAIASTWTATSDRVMATVHLGGGIWSGAVVLETTRQIACALAGAMLMTDPPNDVNDEVRDALGELANMIGGNLKCAVSPGARLSLPMVIDGSDYSMRFCSGRMTHRQAFSCDQGVFWVTTVATPEDKD